MKNKILYALFLMGTLFTSCKKEVAPEEPVILETSDYEKHFKDAGYATKLTQNPNDTISITWNPSWFELTRENVNDSTSYIYVPLYPQAKNTVTGKAIQINAMAVVKFLVIKIGQPDKYFLGQYISSDVNKPISLSNFTGTATLKSLDTNEFTSQTFTNGKQNKRMNADQANARTNNCITTYTCYWYNYDCSNVNLTVTTGQGICPYPPYDPTCSNGWVGTWNMSDGDSETICYGDNVVVIPIPTSTFNANYILYGPQNPIANLSERLNCFLAPRIDGHRYKNYVTLYIDQPVNGSDQLFKLTGQRKLGHAYISLEIVDQTTNQTKRLVFGFYVANEFRAVQGIQTASAWGDDGNSPYDVSITQTFSTTSFNTVVQAFKDIGKPQYHLLNNNCVSLIYSIFGEYFDNYNGGLPNAEQEIGPLGTGKTPAKFGQSVRETWGGDSRHFKLSNGALSPSSTNCN